MDGDANGDIVVRNSASIFKAAGALRIGQTALTAGTPYQINLGGAQFKAGGVFTVAALADLTLDAIGVSAKGQIELLTRGNLTISNGSVLSSGQTIAFYADVSRTSVSADSKLSPTPLRYLPPSV